VIKTFSRVYQWVYRWNDFWLADKVFDDLAYLLFRLALRVHRNTIDSYNNNLEQRWYWFAITESAVFDEALEYANGRYWCAPIPPNR
jgi:hypothetical protein